MSRCPTCYSEIGIWTDDPIKTKNGTAYVFDDEGNLIPNPEDDKQNVGLTEVDVKNHIEELQEARQTQEDTAISGGFMTEAQRTSFTPFQAGDYLTKQHMSELRISTEKLLEAYGIAKLTYFNYDSEGNDMGTTQEDWNDIDILNYEGHIRALHIEDLRHPITILLGETWRTADIAIYTESTYFEADIGRWRAYKSISPGGYIQIHEVAGSKIATLNHLSGPGSVQLISRLLTLTYTPETILTFDRGGSVTSPGQNTLLISGILDEDDHELWWKYGFEGGGGNINLGAITSFNRNLWDDCFTVHGKYPNTRSNNKLKMNWSSGGAGVATATQWIDNIMGDTIPWFD